MTHNLEVGAILEINGARLWVQQSGSGLHVVLIHAGIADSSMWDAQVEALRSEYTVTRLDLRGFGRSDLPPAPYAHRNDVAALLATLQIQSAVILGASYGGKIATQIALENPGLVRGLILINSQVGSTDVSVELQSGWDRVETAEGAGDLDLAVEIEVQMWVDGPHRSAADVDPAVRDQVRRMNGALFARQGEQEHAPEIAFDPPIAERLAELRIPILLINGDLEFDDIRMSAESLVQVHPATIVRPVKGAAHLPNLEQPDKVNELVLDFLNGIQD